MTSNTVRINSRNTTTGSPVSVAATARVGEWAKVAFLKPFSSFSSSSSSNHDDVDGTIKNKAAKATKTTIVQKEKKKKSVRFAEEDEELEIPNRHSYSAAEVADAWYDASEYADIRESIAIAVAKMSTSSCSSSSSSTNDATVQDSSGGTDLVFVDTTITTRGLENRTKEGAYASWRNRKSALDAVLDEVERQWTSTSSHQDVDDDDDCWRYDDEAIAAAYRRGGGGGIDCSSCSSSTAVDIALWRARQDAKHARKILKTVAPRSWYGDRMTASSSSTSSTKNKKKKGGSIFGTSSGVVVIDSSACTATAASLSVPSSIEPGQKGKGGSVNVAAAVAAIEGNNNDKNDGSVCATTTSTTSAPPPPTTMTRLRRGNNVVVYKKGRTSPRPTTPRKLVSL